MPVRPSRQDPISWNFCLHLRAKITILKYMLNYQTSLDQMFQALADPGRRAMIDRLSRGPATVSALAEPLDMTLSAVMQDLAVLEESGPARSEKTGRVRTCQLQPGSIERAEQWLNERRLLWERRLDALGDYLAETKPEKE